MKRESMKKQERWWGRFGAVVALEVLFGLMEMARSG